MANIRIVFLLAIILGCGIMSSLADSGVGKIQLGNDFFDQGIKEVTKMIISEANKHKDNLPELNLQTTLIKFIPVSFNITGLKFEELAYVDNQLTIGHSNQIINVKLNDINLKATGVIDHKIWFFSKREETIDLDLVFSTEVNLNIGLTKEKFITISVSSIEVKHYFNKFDVKGNFLLNFLGNHIKWLTNPINGVIKNTLQSTLTSIFEKVNAGLQNQIDIPALGSSIAIKMEDEIIFEEDSFILSLNFDLEEQKEALKFLPDYMSQGELFRSQALSPLSNAEQIQVAIEENLLNILLGIVLKDKREFNITNDLIPQDFPLKINTLYFDGLIPEMYNKYPNQDLSINFYLESIPGFNFNATQLISSKINFSLAFALKEDPTNTIFSMSIGTTVSLTIDSSKEDKSIHLQITTVQINDAFVLASTIGDISPEAIEKNLNTFIKSLVYFINNYLRINPIPIPIIKGIDFGSINIAVVEENFLQIRIQPKYSKLDWLNETAN